MSAVQDLLVTPLWMALVWVVHALCVMLEWCFTLTCSTARRAGDSDRACAQMQQALTDPWLPLVLAVASRARPLRRTHPASRRDTLGQALMMTAMMVAGLWAIADPGGSVGALGSWANEASLGTLAAAARGTPRKPAWRSGRAWRSSSRRRSKCRGATSSSGMSDGVVTRGAPKGAACSGSEDRLRRALRSGLRSGRRRLSLGSRRQGAGARAQRQLLREADSNGAIFLALPANGPAAQLDKRRRLAAAHASVGAATRPTARAPRRRRPSFERAMRRGRGWGVCC